MNKNIKLFALAIASILGTAQYITAGLINVTVKVGVGVATCTGGHANCNVTTTVNAIGDVITVDVSQVPQSDKKDLGTITEEKLVTVDLPAKTGDLKIYQFKTTEGDLKGTLINLLVQNEFQRPGTRRANQHVFKLSRQLEGEKADQWIEVGDIVIDKKETLTAWPFVVAKNGTWTTFNTKDAKGVGTITFDTEKLPEGVEKVEFIVGGKELNPKN